MPRDVVLRPPHGPLTAAWLATIKAPTGEMRLTIKDSKITGLELRLSATSRSWAVSKRHNGRQRRFTLRNSGRMTLADARKAAELLVADLQKGIDPTAVRREAQQAAILAKAGVGKVWTLRGIIGAYGKTVANQPSWPEREKMLHREYRAVLDLPMERITKDVIKVVLEAAEERDAKVSGWRGFGYLKAAVRWALAEELMTTDPTIGADLKRRGERMNSRARERVLETAEIRALWLAWEAAPNDPYSAMFRLMLLSGQRRGEVAGMCWADLDLEAAEWHQRTNKSARPHVVPLSAAAMAIIEAQSRRRDHVFTSATGAGNFAGAKGNWQTVTAKYSKVAGVTGWTRHDLRRTARTLMASIGVPMHIGEMILNHSDTTAKGGAVASIYDRHKYKAEKRAALDGLATKIWQIVDGVAENVIPFPAFHQ